MTKEELKLEAKNYAKRKFDDEEEAYLHSIIVQTYINSAEPREKRIAEQEELLNSTLDENKEIYKKMADLDTALEDCTESLTDARIKIKELEKENAKLQAKIDDWQSEYIELENLKNNEITELKDKLSNLASVAEVRLANWQKYEKENTELKEQIEKMKCCQNCKFEDNDCIEEPCSSCTRCLGNIKRKGNSDKWELQED